MEPLRLCQVGAELEATTTLVVVAGFIVLFSDEFNSNIACLLLHYKCKILNASCAVSDHHLSFF